MAIWSAIKFDLRLAYRLAKGQRSTLGLIVACVALGIVSMVAVDGFLAHVRHQIILHSRPLLQADVAIRSKQPLTPHQHDQIDAVLPPHARRQSTLNFVTMAYSPKTGKTRLVELKAVSPGYPLYGQVILKSGHIQALQSVSPSILVQSELLPILGIQVGDDIKLGTRRFTVSGIITQDGGSVSPFALGPRVLMGIDHAATTGLIGLGARVYYTELIGLNTPGQGAAVATSLKRTWGLSTQTGSGEGFGPQSELEVRSLSDIQGQLQQAMSRFGDYLSLVSLTAMMLAGVALFYLVNAILKRSSDSIAILRTIGYSAGQIIRAYLVLIVAVAVVGAVLGIGLGIGVGALFPLLLNRLLTVPIGLAVDGRVMGISFLIAVMASGYFSLLALLPIRRLKPALMMQVGLDTVHGVDWLAVGFGCIGVGILGVVASYRANSMPMGIGFTVAMVGAAIIIRLGISLIFLPCIAWIRRKIPSFTLSYALANLNRPYLGIPTILLTLGLSAFLIGIVMVYHASLSTEFQSDHRALPRFFLIDVQPEQEPVIRRLTTRLGATWVTSPIVRARLKAVNAMEISQIKTGRQHEDQTAAAFRNREQNLSFRKQLGSNETIVSGKWMSTGTEISLEDRFAKRLGIHLGDVLTFDVQGVPVTGSVTSIRSVRWNTFTPTFFILLSPELIEMAPHTVVGAVSQLADTKSVHFQTELVTHFPNVTFIDIRQTVAQVLAIVTQLSAAIAGIASFTLAIGMLVIVSVAIATSRQRQQEAALLKTLGATQLIILMITALDYLVMGLVGATMGSIAAVLAGWGLLGIVLGIPVTIPVMALAGLVLGVGGLTATVGTVWAFRVSGIRAAAVFRERG